MIKLVVGSRGSPLSLASTNLVIKKLKNNFPDIEFETRIIKTEGDRKQQISLSQLEVEGIFTKDIEKALLENEIDIAVHSLKDMPAVLSKGLIIGAVLERLDQRDTLICRKNLRLSELPLNANIGTDSPRRKAQLLQYRSDLQVTSLRGNIETRIRKLDEGHYNAIVISAAGLIPLGLQNRITEYFPTDFMLPAQGQGTIAVEIREGDEWIKKIVKSIEHLPTKIAIEAERAFVRYVGGGCKTPMAAYARLINDKYILKAKMLSEDGKKVFKGQTIIDARFPEKSGKRLAQQLLAEGANELVKENNTKLPLKGKRILITTAKEQAGEISDKLRKLGAVPIEFPAIAFKSVKDLSYIDKAVHNLQNYDWIIFTSKNGVKFFFERVKLLNSFKLLDGTKFAAVGMSTANSIKKYGIDVDFVPHSYLTDEIANGIGDLRGKRILLPRADIAGKKLVESLREKGALIDEIAVYQTVSPNSDISKIKRLLNEHKIDIVTFTSSSTVNNFVSKLGESYIESLKGIKVACIGPVTAKTAEDLGIEVQIVSKEHTIDGLISYIIYSVRNNG